jgi:aminoglycoside phosphotransferase (APT) family kinase protein
VPVYAGQPSEKYRWPFAGYVAIGGRSLPSARLSEDERRALTKPLARFLSALHGVNAAAALEGGAPLDVFDRLNTSTRRVRTSECLRGIVNAGVGVDAFRIEAILDTAPAYDPRAETLVHGDLHSAQILVDESNHLAGVIDWGDVHVGDPAVDLAAIHAILPRECHDAFIDMYGVVTDDAWAVARARALWHTTMVLAQAVDTKDDDLAHEAENTLARLVGDRSALSA